MQRITTAFAALALTTLSACAHAQPTPSACPAPEKAIAEVGQAMRDMYAAFQADDLAAFHTVTTNDFFAYDVGERFDGDALLNLIKDLHAKGTVFEWTVNDPKVEVACNMALVTYVNTGSATTAGVRRDLSWLESATLVHDGQRWRIRFFHSTRVPAPPPQQ